MKGEQRQYLKAKNFTDIHSVSCRVSFKAFSLRPKGLEIQRHSDARLASERYHCAPG